MRLPTACMHALTCARGPCLLPRRDADGLRPLIFARAMQGAGREEVMRLLEASGAASASRAPVAAVNSSTP